MNKWPRESQVTFFNSQPWFYEPIHWPIKPNRHINTKLIPNLRDKITMEHELELFGTEVVACHDLIYRSIYLIAIMAWIWIFNIMTE